MDLGFVHRIYFSIQVIFVNSEKNTDSTEWYRVKSKSPLLPSSPFLLSKENHHHYHVNIFLLMFYACIQTQYVHAFPFFLFNEPVSYCKLLFGAWPFYTLYLVFFSWQYIQIASFFLITVKCFIIGECSSLLQMFNAHPPCARHTSRH